MEKKHIGISGLSAYVPPYRVWLEDWCDWTGNHWPKVRDVVGRSFRMRGPDHSVYTMAATAVLRLIRQYDVDASRVKFLGLGTESSTDNSAGAIIIKGMIDRVLSAEGRAPLARSCEVPEFKHACLGGVYGMKAAIRHLALDGAGGQAIVVCADIAEYARGTSGEQTQGAGAVAMLLEEDPALVTIDLTRSGSASDYRIMDFRKPMLRFCGQDRSETHQVQDFPVFNGKYSTTCYIDETLHALKDMYEKRGINPASHLRSLSSIYLHRPYRRMPETGFAVAWLYAMAQGDPHDRAQVAAYCHQAGIEPDALFAELSGEHAVSSLANEQQHQHEAYPLTMAVLRVFRGAHALPLGSARQTRSRVGPDARPRQSLHRGVARVDCGRFRGGVTRRARTGRPGVADLRLRQRRCRRSHPVLRLRGLAARRRMHRFLPPRSTIRSTSRRTSTSASTTAIASPSSGPAIPTSSSSIASVRRPISGSRTSESNTTATRAADARQPLPASARSTSRR